MADYDTLAETTMSGALAAQKTEAVAATETYSAIKQNFSNATDQDIAQAIYNEAYNRTGDALAAKELVRSTLAQKPGVDANQIVTQLM